MRVLCILIFYLYIWHMITENAIIKSVSLGIEDHGCLTLNLSLSMESNGVTFGGISMGSFRPEANLSESSHGNYAAYYITKVLDTVGVDEISQLKGRPVRVIFDGDSLYGGNCIGIQNFLETSKFFIPHMIDPEYKPDLSAILSDTGKYIYEEKNKKK